MFRQWWLETVRILHNDSEVDSEEGSEMFHKDNALLSCGNGIRIATQFRDLTVEVLWWSMFTMFYFRCWQHFSCVKKTMLCSMVLAKVWFFFGCKVLMVSGRKLSFAGSWLSLKVAIGCYHHQQLFIMTRMQHFAIIVKTFQVDLTWSKERVRPASSGHHKSQPLPPSSIPAIHSPASQFASFSPQPRSTVRWLSAGVVGLRPPVPTDWEEDGGGGGTQRLRTPGLPHTCHPPAH